MQTWHWQTWQDLPYLTCSLLEFFPHGFFTQHFSPRSPVDLVGVLHPQAQVYQVRQVHGNGVLTCGEIAATRSESQPSTDLSADAGAWPAADGIVSDQSSQAVWVCSADCVPVLIGDIRTGQVAAIHAGWRGTALAITPQAIARLVQQGSRLSDLRIALGPAIAGEVYQVSTTVAAQVGVTLLKEAVALPVPNPDLRLEADPHLEAEPILEALYQLPDPPLLPDPEPDRIRLDVRRVNALQLERLGLSPQQIAIAPYCTFQHRDQFFSYRRDRLKKVQWSGIVSL